MKTKRVPATKPQLNHPDSHPHLMREIMRTHQTVIGHFSREVGMSASRTVILRLLAVSQRERIGVVEIARSVGLDAAAVTRQVSAMKNAGLVSCAPDPNDGRRVSVQLTPKGVRMFESVHKRVHELEDSVTACISAKDIETTVCVLTAVRRAIENNEEGTMHENAGE